MNNKKKEKKVKRDSGKEEFDKVLKTLLNTPPEVKEKRDK